MKMSLWLETLRKHSMLGCCSIVALSALAVNGLADDERDQSANSQNSKHSTSDSRTESDQSEDRGASNRKDANSSRDNDEDLASDQTSREHQRQQQARSQRERSSDDQSDRSERNSRRQAQIQNREQSQQGQQARQGQNQNRGQWQQNGQQNQWSQNQQSQRGQAGSAQSLGLSLTTDDDDNVYVESVGRQSAARQAGLREDDLIVSVNGQQVSSRREFDRALARAQGRRITLVTNRDNEERTVYINTNQLAQNNSGRNYSYDNENAQNNQQYRGQNQNQNWNQNQSRGQNQGTAFLGVILDQRYQNMAVVSQIYDESPAEEAGLKPGDTITSINGQRIRSPQELSQQVAQHQAGQSIDIQFSRPQQKQAEVRLSTREEAGRAGMDQRQARRDQRQNSRSNQSNSQDSDDDNEYGSDRNYNQGDDYGESNER